MQSRKSNKIIYDFVLGDGLGDISFNMTEANLCNILGSSEKVDVEIYEKGVEETKRYYFPEIGIMITKNLYEGNPEALIIFSEKIIVSGVNLYRLKLSELKRLIKLEHDANNIEYVELQTKETFEDVINYPNMGLTFWFEDEELIDVCIEKPENI